MLTDYDDPMAIRYLLATTHYRRPINYAPDTLAQARAALERIRTGYRNLQFRLADAVPGQDTVLETTIQQQVEAFELAMDDDFNVPNAVAAIFELITLANTYAEATTVYDGTVTKLLRTIETLMGVLGIDGLSGASDLTAEQRRLIDSRAIARTSQDYQTSDELREQLKTLGIIIEDTPQGQRWHRAK